MDTAKVFQSGRSQAVRLPKAYRFEGQEVFVKRMGTAVVLLPAIDSWDILFQACEAFSDDFMTEREQGEFPERPAIEVR
ncbi:MAG: type II toxin-antitoxin system VapB family antitoxin [Verrucomicrobiota bacterium]|nr:type II toxin-antitoxin system VapB family antitoxin [Verrucomicrobiota bacterium]